MSSRGLFQRPWQSQPHIAEQILLSALLAVWVGAFEPMGAKDRKIQEINMAIKIQITDWIRMLGVAADREKCP